MSRESEERKEAVLRKMLPPHNSPNSELAAEERIKADEARAALWHLRQALLEGLIGPERPNTPGLDASP